MKRFLLLLAVAGAAAAFLAWPRINLVETGRTPEYPDLQPREYAAGEQRVTEAVKAAAGRLSRFTFLGSGRGPGGSEVHYVASTLVLRLKDDVNVRIRREGGKTKVTVRSKSRMGTMDFGQNARNVRELLGELDREMGSQNSPPQERGR
jgi:uncharacterized protein (DUF1499 family)